ncbi:MAG: HlyD family efflux transporter periplasmic adaptor subunit [Clostridium sp.]|jgi:multidrug resistance efflux pump|nr:HlyD family efflux transporter periplasmic adaptor subunit [Clostridium sp.]
MIRSKEVKTIYELRDSRLLYDKKMPYFGYVIIIVIFLFLISVVIMSLNTSKVYVVKSPGNVRSNSKNYVMSSFSGKIYDVNIEEGKNVQKGDVLFKVKSTDLNLQKQQIEGQKSIYENQIIKYRKLVKSIKNNTNYFDANNVEDNLYYSQYELYKNQVAQQNVDIETYKLYGYTDTQINSELERAKTKVEEIKNSSIKSAEEAILQAQCQLDSINAQIAALETGQEEYIVTANETGKIHMLTECKEGVVVQAALPLASIASDNEDYMIEAYVSAFDVVRIEKGDDVEIAVSGLSQTQYGTIKGVVENIDTDITISKSSEDENQQSYFKVDIKPDSNFLINKDGDKVNINNGMTVETRIQYDKITYFEYVLDSLGVLAK